MSSNGSLSSCNGPSWCQRCLHLLRHAPQQVDREDGEGNEAGVHEGPDPDHAAQLVARHGLRQGQRPPAPVCGGQLPGLRRAEIHGRAHACGNLKAALADTCADDAKRVVVLIQDGQRVVETNAAGGKDRIVVGGAGQHQAPDAAVVLHPLRWIGGGGPGGNAEDNAENWNAGGVVDCDRDFGGSAGLQSRHQQRAFTLLRHHKARAEEGPAMLR
mmetsp:Transcript_90244/g.250793  ORF Transcript_90244/g.250793 Transcript_90244/m.250793 type:complete len:215 (-) Transcript_90244:277-921(-)